MQYIYLKPQLENLSQGERIAFVRQFRRMTQDEVSDKLGLDGENKRRMADITIKQNLISTRIYMKTKESKSESTSSTLLKKEDSWKLIYTYTNIPNSTERNHSKIHFGTCIFDIIDNKIIGGNYYTDRKTIGDIKNFKKMPKEK